MFGSSKVQIRSASTLGKNNQPIYVIDGVILDNSIKEGNPDWDSNPNDYGNELKNLNPDDFESVSVLKGAGGHSPLWFPRFERRDRDHDQKRQERTRTGYQYLTIIRYGCDNPNT